MSVEAPQGEYERGYRDGQVAVRLDLHDAQIVATNNVLERTVDIASSLSSTVQTLTEARVTDAATRVATAEAVKEAKNAQEAQASSAWTPVQKLVTVTASVVGLLGILWAILSSIVF